MFSNNNDDQSVNQNDEIEILPPLVQGESFTPDYEEIIHEDKGDNPSQG